MKLVFAGTPIFAANALSALQSAGHEIMLVLTRQDRRAGRGMHLQPSPTAEIASSLSLRVEKPVTLKDSVVQAMIRDTRADAMVVAAYGLLLPPMVLDIPRLGCINIHGSLLPRWRGAAPVQRAIEAGDVETGISIMQMDAGLDTGPVLLRTPLAIMADETSTTLFAKLTELGASSIVTALAQLDRLPPRPQPADGVTYARKIEKSEAQIDWAQSALDLERRFRAFDPFPGAEARLAGQVLKIWRAELVDSIAMPEANPPGTIVKTGADVVNVQCGRGILALKTIQKPGGNRLAVADFLRSTPIQAGMSLT
jgi:methionyl-tRNA formyltransferase